eukprot:1205554-Rhodomonas_salina.1
MRATATMHPPTDALADTTSLTSLTVHCRIHHHFLLRSSSPSKKTRRALALLVIAPPATTGAAASLRPTRAPRGRT